MDNEFAADLITLIDDEGTEHEFEILDVIESDEVLFTPFCLPLTIPEKVWKPTECITFLRRSRRMASSSWQSEDEEL